MFFLVTVPSLSFPLWEDEVMEKIGKALGKFIGFIEVRKMVASSIKQEYVYNKNNKNSLISIILNPWLMDWNPFFTKGT